MQYRGPIQAPVLQGRQYDVTDIRLYLGGPAGAGKSTVADLLVRRFGFLRVSLGDVVRHECAARGIPPTRSHLQTMGDALRGGRSAALAIAAHRSIPATAARVVIDGVRLHAEAMYLQGAGYVGMAVEAPSSVRSARLLARDGTVEVSAHVTEVQAETLPVDVHLLNDHDDPVFLGWRLLALLGDLERGRAV